MNCWRVGGFCGQWLCTAPWVTAVGEGTLVTVRTFSLTWYSHAHLLM